MSEEELPLSWNKSVLAILPGLFATMGLIGTDFSARMLAGLIVLVIFLVSGYWQNDKQFPGWGLMAAGMLSSIGLVVASGVIGGLIAVMTGRLSNTFVLLILLITAGILLGFSMKRQPISPLVWGLFISVILCQLAVRIKYFVSLGVSWSVTGQWLNISLYAAMIGLLLPVVFGMLLSQRYGLQTMLFVIGMIYVSFQILIDVNFKVSDQIESTAGFIVYKALIPFLFTVLAPLWYLRAQTRNTRTAGSLSLVGLAVFLNLLVVGFAYGRELPLIIWISFIPYTLSILLTLVLADLGCTKKL
jgi:hypothetical protein